MQVCLVPASGFLCHTLQIGQEEEPPSSVLAVLLAGCETLDMLMNVVSLSFVLRNMGRWDRSIYWHCWKQNGTERCEKHLSAGKSLAHMSYYPGI